MTGATTPDVELRDVFCVHRTPEGDAAALQGTTLAVAQGELVCVIGPNGAGKSTLLRTIAGLQTPSAGIVHVLCHDIGRLPSRTRARIRHETMGFLGQRADAVLSPDLRVAEAVGLPLALRRVERAERRNRVAELLQAVGLADRARALPDELSGGERQRVALSIALVHRPALLLADEPTGELDPDTAAATRKLITELVRQRGITAIVVSHDAVTADMADRAVQLRDGRIAWDRRDGDAALAVGRDGWMQMPPELLREAGIGDRARVRPGPSGLIVSAAPSTAPTSGHGEPTTTPSRNGTEPRTDPQLKPATVAVEALTRSRGAGRPVIEQLTRGFGPGGLIAITGPSGAGKTTLLRLLAGLDLPDAGTVAIDGIELTAAGAEARAAVRRERIGYLPQEPAPVGFLSAIENVVLALRVRGFEPAAASELAAAALSDVGLAGRLRQRVARLSAGEAQRVALARALASARGLLLVDEPTSRLDTANAAAVAALLLQAALLQTVVCATHDPEVIARADEVVELP
jgi:ABC-type lipoprotein export system ATPase subunit